MTQWKAAPRASKEAEQKLWERFRAAQDAFFTRRSEVFSARDAEQRGNLERKQALLDRGRGAGRRRRPARPRRPSCARSRRQWHDAGRVPREAARRAGPPAARRRGAGPAWRWTRRGAAPSRRPTRCCTQMREQVAEAEQRLARAQAAGDAKRINEAEQALASKRQFLSLAEQAN